MLLQGYDADQYYINIRCIGSYDNTIFDMKRLEHKYFIRNGLSNLKYCSGVKRISKYISFAGNTVQIKTDIQSNSFVFHDIKKIAGERCGYKLFICLDGTYFLSLIYSLVIFLSTRSFKSQNLF